VFASENTGAQVKVHRDGSVEVIAGYQTSALAPARRWRLWQPRS